MSQQTRPESFRRWLSIRPGSQSCPTIAIDSLQKLNVKEALPSLRLLLGDDEKSHFGDLVSVSDAARAAIAKLEAIP